MRRQRRLHSGLSQRTDALRAAGKSRHARSGSPGQTQPCTRRRPSSSRPTRPPFASCLSRPLGRLRSCHWIPFPIRHSPANKKALTMTAAARRRRCVTSTQPACGKPEPPLPDDARCPGSAARPLLWPFHRRAREGGAERIRTAVRGFAGPCLTTRPPRRSHNRTPATPAKIRRIVRPEAEWMPAERCEPCPGVDAASFGWSPGPLPGLRYFRGPVKTL